MLYKRRFPAKTVNLLEQGSVLENSDQVPLLATIFGAFVWPFASMNSTVPC